MFPKKITLPLILISVLFLISCASTKPDFMDEDFNQPQKLVILPTINNTVDVAAAEVIRSLSFVNLYNYQYADVMEIVEADSILRESGITSGGQLSSIDTAELHDILDTDGIFIIELKESTYNTTGARREERVIHAEYTMFNNGKMIYQHNTEVENKSGSLVGGIFNAVTDPVGTLQDRATDTLVKGVRGLVLEHELIPEMTESNNEMLITLPGEKKQRSRSERL